MDMTNAIKYVPVSTEPRFRKVDCSSKALHDFERVDDGNDERD
jgi:hypothetical protein